ncbi:hypothetical protein DXZ20_18355 [Leptolyngbyaceae cyanobacterium CCMR0081]|uniref:Transposase n=1 Tax=Adonisia turfae CCMR0081 TaxID=2292702 RepID=A0A6M0RN21_9CYAN|nr:hypothetical protein [Adonisia turfae CCMR0081]
MTYADEYVEIEQLVINLDNGPSLNSHRTQFIKRIVAFAQASRLCIQLIYYPPYHSKYNAIERCWAALENYWNGTILKTVEDALRWAANMTWRGCTPVVDLVDKVYHKGVKASPEELAKLEQQWQRSEQLPKWDVTIIPI